METLTYRQPRIVALIILVLLAAGISSFTSIGRQEDPTITNVFATVKTAFPGANPARVEALVTVEIERELREIPDIKHIDSSSINSLSIVSIQLEDELTDDAIEQTWSKVRDALDDATRLFPQGVGQPDFATNSDGAYAAVIALTAGHSDVPTTIVGRYGEDLADLLRNVPGTKLVDIFGAPEEEVLISIDPAAATALGLTADRISQIVKAADSKVQSGRLRSGESDWLIDIEGEFTALDRIRRVTIREDQSGRVARLLDIASVSRGPKRPQSEMALHNGQPAVLIAAHIQDGQRVDDWMDRVRRALDGYEPTLPRSIEQHLVFDQSRYTAERLSEVSGNMALGAALVIGVLFITLGGRSALVVAIVLPLVGLATLATMKAIGVPIHQMSVTGLVVALGMLVDAAIVMTDDIGRHLRLGLSAIASVRISVRRLFAPLLASTITTVLSFTPMVLLPGPAGDFIGAVAISVVTMLLWSFVIAVTVTPAIAGWMLRSADGTSLMARGMSGGPLGRLFEQTIELSLANPVRSILLALVLPTIGFASLPLLIAQFFPTVERDQFYIEIELADGTAISETHELALAVDSILQEEPEIESIFWVIGRSAPAFYYNIASNRDAAPGYAQAMITAASPEATATLVPDLRRHLQETFPEARILVRRLVQGPPVNAPVELRFVGPDTRVLRQLGDQARRIIIGLETVTAVRNSAAGGAPTVKFNIDETKIRLLGLNLTDISRQLQAGLEGVTGGSLLEGTERLPVRVRVGTATRSDLAAISNFPILPPNAADAAANGHYPGIPLSSVAAIRLEPGESVITRRNAERINTVQAFLIDGVLPEEALRAAKRELDRQGFTLPPGYRLEFGGDADARNTTLRHLLASAGLVITLSIATIVMVLNSFRLSLIVIVVAGLAVGLSLLSLAVFNYPFGINAVIGVIGSIGVSINAAIITLAGLRTDPGALAGERGAMTSVVMDASRHIVSTTVTTFCGFLPLILHGGGFWPPFAMAVAGGVLLSTVVSFYFTPAMFALLYAGRARQHSRPGIDLSASLDSAGTTAQHLGR